MFYHYSLLGRLLFGAGLLAGPALRAGAQTVPADTTRLQYSEEVAAPSSATAAPLRVQREERRLWKLGLNNFLLGNDALGPNVYYTRYGLHLSYERKLGRPAWSVLGEVSPAVATYRLNGGDPRQALSVRAQVAGRYYHNLERRLRQGRSAGNFSANYFALALGAGLGREAHETPFYLFAASRHGLATLDVALLYGVQRRLGRYGFVDANLGIAALPSGGWGSVGPNGSLRVGLALGAPPAAYVPRRALASEVVTLRPRFYAGAQVGVYYYRVSYSPQNPYPPGNIKTAPGETQTTGYPMGLGYGVGVYTESATASALPYVYLGYYVAPRLAVQLGVQREATTGGAYGTIFNTPQGAFLVSGQVYGRQVLALPALLRYSLTASFLRRLQFDAVGGLVPVWSSVAYHDYLIVNRQVTDQQTFELQRSAFGLHASAGVAASYGLGRRRRVQVTAEGVVNKDVRTVFREGREDLQGGASVGLRYRFGYR